MLSTSIPINSTSMTSRATSCARDDVTRAWRYWPSYWDKTWRHGCMVFFRSVVTHCQGGLSAKRPDRICSLLAGRLIWVRWSHMPKFNNLKPISWPWENFLVSMKAKWFPWKRTSPDFFRARPRPPWQVWRLLARKRRSSFRTNAATNTTQIIVRFPDMEMFIFSLHFSKICPFHPPSPYL